MLLVAFYHLVFVLIFDFFFVSHLAFFEGGQGLPFLTSELLFTVIIPYDARTC